MPEYRTPGVYVEEVSTGAKPIESVSTTTAAFLGVAPKDGAFLNEVHECNSWTEFIRDYCDDKSAATPLAYGLYGYFMNGGRRAYVLNVGAGGSLTGDARKGTGISQLEAYDEPAMVLAPGFTTAADYRALIDHAEKMKDRVAILDAPAKIGDTRELTSEAMEDAPAPSPSASAPKDAPGGTGAATPGGAESARRSAPAPARGKKPPESKYAACYFPWLVMQDPFDGKNKVTVPPSGHMAGIYAMNDTTRGVHKAPANYPIRTAIGLSQLVTPDQQGELNAIGVNCIRAFAGSGIRVWGARLLARDPEWRYINVRRLFLMMEKSIANGTNWVVFEPNDQVTRNSVARDCRDYLKRQWIQGALVGATREQAYFVKCDSENNPQEVVDAGRLIVDIGVAPSKPAEFIVFRIGQWAGGTEVKAA